MFAEHVSRWTVFGESSTPQDDCWVNLELSWSVLSMDASLMGQCGVCGREMR